uniref:Uncharacterized protein n=1 Tax=Davidia involucrata TaxID=16924 RepID=A0A5B7BXG1_DAVIN
MLTQLLVEAQGQKLGQSFFHIAAGFGSNDAKSEPQWFVDALNSIQISPLETSPSSAANLDYLFGFNKGQASQVTAAKLQDPPLAPTILKVFPNLCWIGLHFEGSARHRRSDGDPEADKRTGEEKWRRERQRKDTRLRRERNRRDVRGRYAYKSSGAKKTFTKNNK